MANSFLYDKDGKRNIEFIKGAKFTPWPMVDYLLLIIHWGGTSGQGIVNTFLDKRAQGSAHYIVFETGRIVQMVDERFPCWGAGVSRLDGFPTELWIDGQRKMYNTLNVCAIQIECAGPPTVLIDQKFKLVTKDNQSELWNELQNGWPEKEIQSLIDLCKDIYTRHNQIQLTDHWAITEHGKPWSRSDVRDGKGINIFPWEKLVNETGIKVAA